MQNNTKSYFYYIDRKELYFIVNVFEAHEGIAVIYTVDPKKGIQEFMVHDSCKDEFDNIMEYFIENKMAILCDEKVDSFINRNSSIKGEKNVK